MEYSVDVDIYVLNIENEEYDEVPLEVVFSIEDNSAVINDYLIDGKAVSLNSVREHNPYIEKHIDIELDHFMLNFEEDYMDNE